MSTGIEPGYRVGGWTVRAPIAEGAFGSVHRATRTEAAADRAAPDREAPEREELPAEVALKFLPTGTSTPRQLRRLRDLVDREVTLLERLSHPRLIRMYETLTVDDPARPELDGATVLVLARADRSLTELLDEEDREPLDPVLLAQVCEGLAQLHDAGWVHGDLKPGNVLLMAEKGPRRNGPAYRALLSDFNLAAELEGTHAYSPAFSTPDYSPPELLWAEFTARGQQIRTTADIWAFGVLAHVALTGTYPMPGGSPAARREAAARYARGEEELRLSPALPEGWAEIVTDCLARSHQERAAHDAASLARRVAALAGTPRPRRPLLRQLPRPRRPRTRRGRLLAISTAAATVLGAATGVSLLYGGGEAVATGWDRCLEGNVCFFTESEGRGDMCAWWGDDENWLTGEIRCDWRENTRVRSIYNNGIDADAGQRFIDVVYYGRVGHVDRLGCVEVGTRTNLTGDQRPHSHHWAESCPA